MADFFYSPEARWDLLEIWAVLADPLVPDYL
jgi:hypothetical protein